MYQTLNYSEADAIATIAFARPEQMNALNKTMADELADCTSKLQNNPNIKVVILKGEGKLFMAGGDVQFFYENLDTLETGVRPLIETVHQSIETFRAMPQIVVASVHGSVAGVGLSFMLASDLVVAAENTKFTLAYTKLGTTADGGATYFLPRIVGMKKAFELALLSGVINTEQARTYGLVNFAVAETELAAQTSKLAQQLMAGPSLAFARVKQLLNQSLAHDLTQQLDMEEDMFTKSVASEDFKIGVKAFINKTKAEFKGA
ncbi:MAG: enoyl-CoA hydratase-related protein [Pseudomonadota bacterium]